MSLFPQPAIAGSSWLSRGYLLDRSLRFRSSASAYLDWTPASAGNTKKWTWSGWVKRATSGVSESIIHGGTDGTSNYTRIIFLSTDIIDFFQEDGNVKTFSVRTTALYRDPSSWYHIIVAYDSDNATASERAKIYVNGSQVTDLSTADYPPSGTQSWINKANDHRIGNRLTSNLLFDGYMTEINFIDGQALTADDFGEYDADTGVWKPKAYSGSYGTNGFYLDFNDPTSTSTISQDQSGNGNDWTANNISLTSGTTYDSMTDVPTLTNEDAANFCTLNPLTLTVGGGATATSGSSTDGNLKWLGTGGNDNVFGTMAASSGKWYYELEIVANPSTLVAGWSTTDELADSTQSALVYYNSACIRSGSKTSVWDTDVTTGLTFSNGDLIGFALDIDGGDLKVYQNNSLISTITLPTDKGDQWIPAFGDSSSTDASFIVNFGQRPFAYTPPTGFKKLNTYNLPDSTIVDGSEQFNTVLYSGDGTNDRAITGVGFQPDFTWLKARNDVADHTLFDAVRGAGSDKALYSNGTYAEGTYTAGFDAFLSDGFQVDDNVYTNSSSNTYVAWNWKANGSGVSNSDGDIPSTVSANTTAGFSIVSYTGTGSAGTVGHGLNQAPDMVIIKNRTDGGAADQWYTHHSGLSGSTYFIELDTSNQEATQTTLWDGPFTSSVFDVKTNNGVNGSGDDMIAYCFAGVEGFSNFSSYTGNGSADGPFIYTGFRPAWLLVKKSSAAENWYLFDTARSTFNVVSAWLDPDLANAEGTILSPLDIVSNGFKFRSNNTAWNASGATYIYAAFAENPFKNALAR